MAKVTFCCQGAFLLLIPLSFLGAGIAFTVPTPQLPRHTEIYSKGLFELELLKASIKLPSAHVKRNAVAPFVGKASELDHTLQRLSGPVANGQNSSQHIAKSPQWNSAVSKGRGRCLSLAPACIRPPTNTFTAEYPDDFRRWGWDPSVTPNVVVVSIGGAVAQLGLSKEDAVRVIWDQIEEFKGEDGNEKVKPTDGYYKNTYNGRQGWIVAEDIFSPAKIAKRPPRDLPRLQRWSDVTWLEWTHQCQLKGTQPSSLRYIFDKDISTPETRAVISEALGQRGLQPTAWPGHDFALDTDEGAALFGTMHGTGPFFLLADHGQEIPKVVSRVTVFFSGDRPQLLWHLEPSSE